MDVIGSEAYLMTIASRHFPSEQGRFHLPGIHHRCGPAAACLYNPLTALQISRILPSATQDFPLFHFKVTQYLLISSHNPPSLPPFMVVGQKHYGLPPQQLPLLLVKQTPQGTTKGHGILFSQVE